jgi:phosphoribosylaminoimidazole-succinocarboxamide synthase
MTDILTIAADAALALMIKASESKSAKLERLKPGKVREIFRLRDFPGKLAIFVTDRWSARDFVFGFTIPGIGITRNIMTISWKRRLRNQWPSNKSIRTDLVAYGRYIDQYLPKELQGNRELWKRVTIVDELDMIPNELIIRFNSVGGINKDSHKVPAGEDSFEFCGNVVPARMPFGMEFSPPLCTPTTKEAEGHDLNVPWQQVEEQHPGLIAFGVEAVSLIHDNLAAGTAGNLNDIKIEVGRDKNTGEYVFGDEVSPDSCRFTLREDYPSLLSGTRVKFRDKEFGREWADKMGIQDYDPKNAEHQKIVADWTGDQEFVSGFKRRYDEACVMNTGYEPEEYLRLEMNI